MSARLRRYLTVLTLLGVALLVWGLSVAKVTERRENFWFARVKSKEPGLKAEAVYELCRLGSKAKSLIPDLTEMLKDEDPTNRCNSAEILGSIGPDAIEAVPCLADML